MVFPIRPRRNLWVDATCFRHGCRQREKNNGFKIKRQQLENIRLIINLMDIHNEIIATMIDDFVCMRPFKATWNRLIGVVKAIECCVDIKSLKTTKIVACERLSSPNRYSQESTEENQPNLAQKYRKFCTYFTKIVANDTSEMEKLSLLDEVKQQHRTSIADSSFVGGVIARLVDQIMIKESNQSELNRDRRMHGKRQEKNVNKSLHTAESFVLLTGKRPVVELERLTDEFIRKHVTKKRLRLNSNCGESPKHREIEIGADAIGGNPGDNNSGKDQAFESMSSSQESIITYSGCKAKDKSCIREKQQSYRISDSSDTEVASISADKSPQYEVEFTEHEWSVTGEPEEQEEIAQDFEAMFETTTSESVLDDITLESTSLSDFDCQQSHFKRVQSVNKQVLDRIRFTKLGSTSKESSSSTARSNHVKSRLISKNVNGQAKSTVQKAKLPVKAKSKSSYYKTTCCTVKPDFSPEDVKKKVDNIITKARSTKDGEYRVAKCLLCKYIAVQRNMNHFRHVRIHHKGHYWKDIIKIQLLRRRQFENKLYKWVPTALKYQIYGVCDNCRITNTNEQD